MPLLSAQPGLNPGLGDRLLHRVLQGCYNKLTVALANTSRLCCTGLHSDIIIISSVGASFDVFWPITDQHEKNEMH